MAVKDRREVVQQEVQAVVIRYNLCSHAVQRHLRVESVENRQTLRFPSNRLEENKSDRDESLNWNAKVFEDLLPDKVDDEALFDGCCFLL